MDAHDIKAKYLEGRQLIALNGMDMVTAEFRSFFDLLVHWPGNKQKTSQ